MPTLGNQLGDSHFFGCHVPASHPHWERYRRGKVMITSQPSERLTCHLSIPSGEDCRFSLSSRVNGVLEHCPQQEFRESAILQRVKSRGVGDPGYWRFLILDLEKTQRLGEQDVLPPAPTLDQSWALASFLHLTTWYASCPSPRTGLCKDRLCKRGISLVEPGGLVLQEPRYGLYQLIPFLCLIYSLCVCVWGCCKFKCLLSKLQNK